MEKGSSAIKIAKHIFRLRWVCLGVAVGFNFLSGRDIGGGGGGGHKNLIRKRISRYGSTKSKVITEQVDKLLSRWAKLSNNMEVNTLTTLGIIRTTIRKRFGAKKT